MADHTAPKQWMLTTTETINSFDVWRQNPIYRLSLNQDSVTFLEKGFMWKKKSAKHPTRGLKNNSTSVPIKERRTSQQKSATLRPHAEPDCKLVPSNRTVDHR